MGIAIMEIINTTIRSRSGKYPTVAPERIEKMRRKALVVAERALREKVSNEVFIDRLSQSITMQEQAFLYHARKELMDDAVLDIREW